MAQTPTISAIPQHMLAVPDEDPGILSDVMPSADPSRPASTAPETESDLEGSDVDMEDSYEPNGVTATPQSAKARAREEAASARQERRSKKRQQDGQLSERRHELDKQKVATAMKRYSYLLGQTELFQHFMDAKQARDPDLSNLLEPQKKTKGKKTAAPDHRHRKSEKEEDEELLKENEKEDEEDEAIVFESSPPYVTGGTLRDYQVQGLNWMVDLYHHGLNGILADEMGLGKTLQTVAFLGYLKYYRGKGGPHLVVVPKSTLDNWAREFAKWVPDFNVVVLQGTREERAKVIQETLLPQHFEICVTSYEMCLRETSFLRKLSFGYIIIDEAHRIKNINSILSRIVRELASEGRLLITGTPLQNNLQELFSLLNFICPEIFTDYEDLESFLHKDVGGSGDVEMDDDERNMVVVRALHKILRPFLLRRVKSDVEKSLLPKKEINLYVGLTDMQRKLYRSVLEKDIEAVRGMTGKKEGKTRLMNIVMQLRKVTCHPYLFDGVEPGPPYTTDEHLVENAGKMLILDKLLKAMKARGSRVLIFSQMSRMLDVLEDYCMFRGYQYCRIDGGTAHEDRIAGIDEYNKEGSEKFVFLLTTRAGGLGINLTTADVVVLYDSDWNPQADLQAMDRAHRIGQTKQVYVYRFITEGSVEERMLERAAQKLRLDQLVIQQQRGAQQQQKAASKDELLDMIHHGAEKIANSADDLLVNDDIDEIIARGEKMTAELNSKYESLNLDDLTNFKTESTIQTWEGENFEGRKFTPLSLNWLEPEKRARKANYSIDQYYKDTMRAGPVAPPKPKMPRAPKQVAINDYQFFPPRLSELYEKESNYFRKTQDYKVPLPDPENEEDTPEDREARRQKEQETIDDAVPLTEEENAEKDALSVEGFQAWQRRDYQAFIRGSADFGKDAWEDIANEIKDKSVREVQEYAKVFWERIDELEDKERILQRIEEGEQKREKTRSTQEILDRKVKQYTYPMQELELHYNVTKGKVWSEEEDRYLLVRLQHYKLARDDVFDLIKKDISQFPQFRFDWFIKSRTSAEISRRCTTLLNMLRREVGEAADDDDDEKPTRQTKKTADKENKGKSKRKLDDIKAEDTPSHASPAPSVQSNGVGPKKKSKK
ncbi:SNF2 family DNA-dependent ATPase [Calocera viscosa TUFC12733]|uniref:SNF2 family DNA-dependent ATPase n=1 Tax=Calocera viscosa (strain TUFC12733) TaxID=1330018 RepID=A0A167H4X0_CALVF|nr:SNF2 family DNA-dependent ATPase [Calocera viscosa TUFC12733]